MGLEAGSEPVGLPGVEGGYRMGVGAALFLFPQAWWLLWSEVWVESGLGRPGMNVDSAHTSCVSLGRLLHLPEPWCFHLLTGGKNLASQDCCKD